MGKQYIDNQLTACFYVGTEYGTFMSVPGHSYCRDLDDPDSAKQGDRLLNCKDYNPTERPWYSTAATGDRDIVFLYDRNLERSSTLGAAFEESLRMTDEHDAVSVRAFDNSDHTMNWMRSDGDVDDFGLRKVNSSVQNKVLEKLPTTAIPRASNLRAALRDAIPTRHDSNVTTSCSRFIVVMLGSEESCFSTCSVSKPCTCTGEILDLVETEQSRFKDGNKATLVTSTERVGNMNAHATAYIQGLDSTLAC